MDVLTAAAPSSGPLRPATLRSRTPPSPPTGSTTRHRSRRTSGACGDRRPCSPSGHGCAPACPTCGSRSGPRSPTTSTCSPTACSPAGTTDRFVRYRDGRAVQVIPPTGRRIAAKQTHVHGLRDGRVVSHAAVRDDLGMLTQLGLILPSPAALGRSLGWRLSGRAQRAAREVSAAMWRAADCPVET